jgi:fructose-1,6-bisphosphatase/inositol monophosphatase family enzyme
VDPVDGTTNFVHAVPYSCISIGLAYRREAVLGVVFNPVVNEMFTAIKGCGAFLNDSPIAAAATSELVYSLVATGIPYDKSYLRDTVQGSLQVVQREAQGNLSPCSFSCG